MRTQDAKLFTDNLAEIVASRPDVLESVTEYFKTLTRLEKLPSRILENSRMTHIVKHWNLCARMPT